MAEPFTLMAIGSTAGALLNPNDPVKGAVMGGALGYGGGSALGLGATQAAAPIANATYAAGAPQIAGLTAGQAPGILAANAPVSISSIAGGRNPVADVGFIPQMQQTPVVPSAFDQAVNTSLGGPKIIPTPGGMGAAGGASETAGLLGGSTRDQLLVANMLMGSGQQQPQRLPNAPPIQSRPYTGMKQPVNPQEEELRRMAMYQMPQMQPIRLI